MDFVSFAFAALYLVALLLRFTIGTTGRGRLYALGLVLLSAVSYGWHIPEHYLLLVLVVLLHFYSGLTVEHCHEQQKSAKTILVASIAINIAILAAFRYANPLLNTMIKPAEKLIPGSATLPDSRGIVLPIAISFYTLQTLSYTIDVYRKRIPTEKSLVSFFFYIGFLPQLVAGPIVRAWEFLYQIVRMRRPTLNVY